jgi:hypothetical protein
MHRWRWLDSLFRRERMRKLIVQAGGRSPLPTANGPLRHGYDCSLHVDDVKGLVAAEQRLQPGR